MDYANYMDEYLEKLDAKTQQTQKSIITRFCENQTEFLDNLKTLSKDTQKNYNTVVKLFSAFVESKITESEAKTIIENRVTEMTKEKLEREAKQNEKTLQKIAQEKLQLAKLQSDISEIEDFEAGSIPNWCMKWDIKENIPDPNWANMEIIGDNYRIFANLMRNGVNRLILCGSAGLAKSESIYRFFSQERVPVFRYQASVDSSASELLESRTITLENDKQVVKSNLGILTKAMITANISKKAVIVIEEANAMPPKIQKLFNSLTDKINTLDTSMGKITLNSKANLIIIFTMNTGNFAAIHNMNRELLDRFCVLEFKPNSESQIRQILETKYTEPINQDSLNYILSCQRTYNRLVSNGEISDSAEFSTRTIMHFVELTQKGIPDQTALQIAFSNKIFDSTDRSKFMEAI